MAGEWKKGDPVDPVAALGRLDPWSARCMHARCLAARHGRSFVWGLQTIHDLSQQFGFGFWETDPRVYWSRDDLG